MSVQLVKTTLRGTILANGALCIASVAGPYAGDFTILAFREGSFDPYVVWNANQDGECWRGDYCSTLEEAMEAFERRTGVRP
jgi:hypothetical protein